MRYTFILVHGMAMSTESSRLDSGRFKERLSMNYINSTFFSGGQIPVSLVFVIIFIQFVMSVVIFANEKSLKIVCFKVGAVFVTLSAYICMLVQIINRSTDSELLVFSSIIMGAASNMFFDVACLKSANIIKCRFYISLSFLGIFTYFYVNYGWENIKYVSFLMALLVGSVSGFLKEIYMKYVKE